jgi:hypothetical protein
MLVGIGAMILLAGCSTLGWLPGIGLVSDTPTPAITTQLPSATPIPPSSPTSPAVTDWAETAPGANGDARSFRVISWSGGFAALGAGHPPAGLTFWTSVDGATWRTRALPIHGAGSAWLQAFGSGILLTAISNRSQEQVAFAFWIWHSGAGWAPSGSLAITVPLNHEPLVTYAIRPGRWLVYGGILPVVCCGGAQAAGAVASARKTTWAWASDDGFDWSRQRLGPVANSLWQVVTVGSSFWGVADGEAQPWLVQSDDGFTWRRRFQLPDDLNRQFAYQLVSVGDGLVVSGQTKSGIRWHEAVWRYDLDGNMHLAADMPGAYLDSFGVSNEGNDVIGVGSQDSDAGRLAEPIVIVSRDGGTTFSEPVPIEPDPGRMLGLGAAVDANTVIVAPASRVIVYRGTLSDTPTTAAPP